MTVGTLAMLTDSYAGFNARTVGRVIDRTKSGRKIVSYTIRMLSAVGGTDIVIVAADGVSKIGN